jgi:hypothetical protein
MDDNDLPGDSDLKSALFFFALAIGTFFAVYFLGDAAVFPSVIASVAVLAAGTWRAVAARIKRSERGE